MTTREDILERLAYADALGHGPQTSALIAEAVSWADALGDEDLRIATRLALTEAYQQGNEAWKALAPFSWNLGRYQRRPEAFDDAQVRTLHWHFKWAVAVAGANPRVSKDKVRQLEASLEEFYRSGGASMHVVHGERASIAGLLGLEEEAAEELAAWRATHRDENADCEGCDPMRQVAFAYRTEAWELAVATAVPVLTGAVSCSVQPQTTQSLVLLPLLASGRPRAAWEAHLRSYREIRRNPKALISLAYHLEYLALVGRVDRGLELLRRHLSWLAQAESAYVLLSALRGMSLVLREAERAGRGEEAHKHILCAQHRPRQGVTEHTRENRVTVGAEQRTCQEGLPQSAHPVFEGTHVVAHVLTPGKTEANERAEHATLRGTIEHLTRSEDQCQNTNSLAYFFDEGTRDDGRHDIDRIVAQVARGYGRVNDCVAVSRKDQRATGSPAERGQPGQHCGPGPHHGGRARATRQRSVSSTEATNSRASCPSQCGSPSRSRTRAQAARASSRSPRSACRRASMHRARDAESRSSVSM